jgi:hypothetical protein
MPSATNAIPAVSTAEQTFVNSMLSIAAPTPFFRPKLRLH